MTKIIKETEVFDEGLFYLANEIVQKRPCPQFKHILLTGYERRGIRDWVLNAIKKAQRYVKLCSFIITDEEVVAALAERLTKFDLAIFILTQLDERRFTASWVNEEEADGDSGAIHLQNLSNLYQWGAHIRASDEVHAKFCIVDGNDGLITSANLTEPSLSLNPESGIAVKGNTLKGLEQLFDGIYLYGTTYRSFISAGKNRKFVASNKAVLPAGIIPPEKGNLRFTYADHNHSLFDALCERFSHSNGDIYMSTYSCVRLNSLERLMREIKAKIEGGHRVNLFCRAMNHRPDHLAACNELLEIGCEIRGDLFNHSKGIVADSEAMLFTANIDGYHGLKSGFEVGVVIKGEAANELSSLIKWQFDTAPFHFQKAGIRKGFFATYLYYCDIKGVEPKAGFDKLTIKLDPQFAQLHETLSARPFYLVFESNQAVALSVGFQQYQCSLDGSVLCVTSKLDRPIRQNTYLVCYHQLHLE